MDIARNHTTTHLLHKALREVLGSYVEQAGSLVDNQKLRFDFTHFQALTEDELRAVEERVNQKIFESLPVEKQVMKIDEARTLGAMALFGEKYGETVRVIRIGDFSIELCGGTHLDNSSQASMLKIISETGVAAGVRRIEGITGRQVYAHLNHSEGTLDTVAHVLRTQKADIISRTEGLQSEVRLLQKEVETLRRKSASGNLDAIIEEAKVINGVSVVTHKFDGLDLDTLRNLGDQLKDKLGNALVVLANVEEDKVTFLAMASDSAVKSGIHSGNIIKAVAAVAGGSGGGRPNTAQAGAKEVAKAEEALKKVFEILG